MNSKASLSISEFVIRWRTCTLVIHVPVLAFNMNFYISFYQASSVLFAVGQVNCLLGLGTNTGLVVDVGYNETIVLPVST